MSEVNEFSLPRRPRDSHKGDYGRVCIIAGKVGFTGAPILASVGALRTGAGLVTVGVPQAIYSIVAGQCMCAMPTPLKNDEKGGLCMASLPEAEELCREKDGVLIGPGLGRDPEAFRLVRELARKVDCPLVLDADGINALEGHIDVLRERRGRVTVLTPHNGELARLLGHPVGEDREEEVLRFARENSCFVVAKSHRTLVVSPSGQTYVNETGNPGMASGGSGDVLSGMILSLIGQSFWPMEACKLAVYLHGLAGDLAAEILGEYGMTPADILLHLPMAVRRLEEKPK